MNMQFFLVLMIYVLFIALLAGLVKVFGEFLRTKFMRRYVSDRMYDVAMGVIIGQLFVTAVGTPIIALILQGIFR